VVVHIFLLQERLLNDGREVALMPLQHQCPLLLQLPICGESLDRILEVIFFFFQADFPPFEDLSVFLLHPFQPQPLFFLLGLLVAPLGVSFLNQARLDLVQLTTDSWQWPIGNHMPEEALFKV